VPCEIVIVLNGSPEPVVKLVREGISGAEVVESAVNRGVAGGYNLGRESARGDFVVLLHDDVEVRPGWLEALVNAADECPAAGAVGSRTLDPDGTLQAAGAIVWRDGMTEPVGRGEPAGSSAYRLRRRVDYCGSNSLLVRAATWDAVGGMDEALFPAYHVDVDLGMKIRAHGQLVLYEPTSEVTHHRWGLEAENAFRMFAARRNQRRFVEKWRSALESHVPREGGNLDEALARVEHEPAAHWTASLPDPGRLSDADYLRADLALKDAYIAGFERRHAEGDRALREVAELRKQLAGIKDSRIWRLHELLLPVLKLVSRRKPI
jgi:GT2 family glycosyltransferase